MFVFLEPAKEFAIFVYTTLQKRWQAQKKSQKTKVLGSMGALAGA